jgi:RNA polymerase sigma factor (TIGR02999 family)
VREEPGDLTQWLQRLASGDPQALDEVVRLVYGELRDLARARLREERPGHTLSPTALVNEAYLRLFRTRRIAAADRRQFFAVAANTMRRILVDYARTRKRLKRGGGAVHEPLEEVEAFLSLEEADEIVALDAALTRLEVINPRGARVVEQRFYAGLSVEETAELLEVSAKTVQRDWIASRAWLRKEVARGLEAP